MPDGVVSTEFNNGTTKVRVVGQYPNDIAQLYSGFFCKVYSPDFCIFEFHFFDSSDNDRDVIEQFIASLVEAGYKLVHQGV
jgi:hypothetical protein